MRSIRLYADAKLDAPTNLGAAAVFMRGDRAGFVGSASTKFDLTVAALLCEAVQQGLGFIRRRADVTVYVGSRQDAQKFRRARVRGLFRPFSERFTVRVRLPRRGEDRAFLDRCRRLAADELSRAVHRAAQYRTLPRPPSGMPRWPVRFEHRRPGPQHVAELLEDVLREVHHAQATAG